jgi:hypothetical protein
VFSLAKDGCLYCFDPFCRQGYITHFWNKGGGCPLQKRLKRIVLHQFEKSRENRSIEQYYTKIVSDKTSFYDLIANTSAIYFPTTITVLTSSQVVDSDVAAPKEHSHLSK